MRDSDRLPHLPTRVLLLYLLTVYAWIFQIGAFFMRRFRPQKTELLAYAVLMVVTIVLTVLASMKGKSVFRQLAWTRGQIPLTGIQVVIVTIVAVGLGGMMGWAMCHLSKR